MGTDLNQWLTSLGGQKIGEIGFFPFLILMGISLLCSLFISYLYARFYKNRATGSQVHRAFPLIGLSITAIFICIQFSLPLSLGLLGALSIVRFRTPIKEPEEIGFIMLVVATSLACATFNMIFLGIILIVAVIGLLILRFGGGFLKRRLNDGMLIITLLPDDYRQNGEKLIKFLAGNLPKGRIDSVVENEEESIVSYSFVQLEESMLLDVQREVRVIASGAKLNIFFNHPGEV